MSINRKDFLKALCLSGSCVCGFSSIALSKNIAGNHDVLSNEQGNNPVVIKEWISSLLQNITVELDEESARKLIKKTFSAHYKDLKMDNLLAEYRGDLDKFIAFLQDNWGWKVNYDKEKKILVADENKNYCVCPVADYNKEIDSSAICYCSEGFAEKMFSTVIGTSVKAEIISSIRKGNPSCKYKIVF